MVAISIITIYYRSQEGYDLLNPEYYSKITKEDLSHILRSDSDVTIPLFNNRLTILHEVGKTLIDKYNGTFMTCVKLANKSARNLLKIIVEDFPCFRDEVVYKGKFLSLYKRAQILIGDLWYYFDGKTWGEFEDIDKVTLYADYRIPQVLVYFGAMGYSEGLMKKLQNGKTCKLIKMCHVITTPVTWSILE